ncbi:MAG TPA: ATP-binding cassette domain-containing protein [Ktedonobacteraceae bacterium]|nr:ATP-binding cassette domain-containing protein [Ktedonobacteraceae bacterium]
MLQVRRLEKTIDNRTALSIEELDINAGDIVTVVGQIGSGKTLLIRLLCGMLVPSGGKVLFDGKDVHTSPEARSHIGVMFEEDLLYDRMNALGNLDLYCRLHNLPASRAGEVLALLGLSDQSSKAVSKLSPVAQRRLAFARALIGRPSVLLLDQPELRIDLDTQSLFMRLIRELASEGTAILLTAEDLAWSGQCSTQIVELADGHVVSKRVRESTQAAEPAIPERLTPFKIPARKEDRIMLFDPGELLYATSREGKTYLRTANEEATTNLTLQELETRLAGRGFFKAHRAYLVNLQHIKAVIQFTRNSYTLQLNDKQETMIPLSKQSEKELQELLGY